MVLQEDLQAAGLQPSPELSELRSDPAFPREASETKGPAPQALLRDGREGPDSLVREAEDRGKNPSGDKRHSGRPRRRHPFAVPIAMVLVASVAAGGYLYWDDARHFESTHDAFIAARQFPLAPKVSGYITALPVPANEHVAPRDVVAPL